MNFRKLDSEVKKFVAEVGKSECKRAGLGSMMQAFYCGMELGPSVDPYEVGEDLGLSSMEFNYWEDLFYKKNSWFNNLDDIMNSIDISNIPEENKNGNCFEVALNKFMQNPKRYTLVHGVVTGQGPLEGIQYCHAWVIDEKTDKVIDMTLPSGKQQIPVGLYYYIGKISITKEYDASEVLDMLDKYGTYGPWDSIFDPYLV